MRDSPAPLRGRWEARHSGSNSVSTPSAEVSAAVPLVGRHREIETFRSALGDVAAGSPRVIRLGGDVGTGRTRLLREFARLAGESGAKALLAGTGSEDEAPLGGIRRSDDTCLLPAFQRALDEVDAESDYFGRLIDALAEDARAGPVWLLLDDVHTADEATRTLTERVVAAACHGRLRDCRVGLVVSLIAAADAELDHRLAAQDRRHATHRIELAPLDGPEVRHWLDTRFAGTVDDGVVTMLGEASAGNPLLLTELTVHLQRADMLRDRDGRVTLESGSGTDGSTLPRSLTALLHGKIGAVSPQCRSAMTLAAFLGNEFDAGALAGLLQQEQAELDRLIEEAARASLVTRGEDDRVSFKHASARDLLYTATDRAHREQTHMQVCEGLIGELGQAANEHCLTITHHLLRAGERAEPELVLRFASRAADVAFKHHSYFLAGRYYEAAARAADGILGAGDRANLYCRAGEAFQRWSDGERSSAAFRRAVGLYDECRDLSGFARALQGLLRNDIAFGDTSAGGEAASTAARLQGLLDVLPTDDVELKVRLHDTLAAYHHNDARYDIAEAHAQTAMSIAAGSDDPTLRCIPVTSLGLAQMEQLRLQDARATWLEGLSYDRAAGATRYEGLHLQRLPVVLYCMGEIHEAARYNRASYRHNQAIGNTAELSLNLGVDVMICNLRGDFDAAIDAGREAMDLIRDTRYLWNAPSLIAGLAYALTMRRRFEQAEAVIEHLSTPGLMFEDTGPYRSTALRLERLLSIHGASPDNAPAAADQPRRDLRGVRLGSLGRLCNEAELALFENRVERLTGVHDALEFVHRRGPALSLGWCGSIPRALAVSTALRNGFARAEPCFAEADRLGERLDAPLELARVSLYRGLAALADVGADAARDAARRDLSSALERFESLGAPVLAALARDALSRPALRSETD